MTSLTTSIAAAMQIDFVGDADLGGNSFNLAKFADIVLSDGTANDQADRVFADKRSLAAVTKENLDLAGGSLLDPVGGALTFVKVKGLLVRAAAANADDIRVGGNVNAFIGPLVAATGKFDVKPDGVALFVAQDAGWTVTPGTGDILDVENLAAAISSYDIIIIGTSV